MRVDVPVVNNTDIRAETSWDYGVELASYVNHETGHLLGFAHAHERDAAFRVLFKDWHNGLQNFSDFEDAATSKENDPSFGLALGSVHLSDTFPALSVLQTINFFVRREVFSSFA